MATDHKIGVGRVEYRLQAGLVGPRGEDFVIISWCGVAEKYASKARNL
jgi:hypothetical protein